jgi:hypothetical protein
MLLSQLENAVRQQFGVWMMHQSFDSTPISSVLEESERQRHHPCPVVVSLCQQHNCHCLWQPVDMEKFPKIGCAAAAAAAAAELHWLQLLCLAVHAAPERTAAMPGMMTMVAHMLTMAMKVQQMGPYWLHWMVT